MSVQTITHSTEQVASSVSAPKAKIPKAKKSISIPIPIPNVKISRTSEVEAKKSRAIPPSKWTEGKNGRRMLYKPKINQEPS